MNIISKVRKEFIKVAHNNPDEMRKTVTQMTTEGWSPNIRLISRLSLTEADIQFLTEQFPTLTIHYAEQGNLLGSPRFIYYTEHERELDLKLEFQGWYCENGEKIKEDDVWKKDSTTYSSRLDGYFVGFEPISGINEEGVDYYYDAVRVFIYLDDNGKEVSAMEFIPWCDGEEVRNTEISTWLKDNILNSMKVNPIPYTQEMEIAK